MIKRALIFFTVSLLCLGCSSSQQREFDQKTILFTKEKIVLDHGELLIPHHVPICTKLIGKDSLMIYDLQSKQLAIFNLKSGQNIWRHKFSLEGPDFIDSPVFDMDFKEDTIMILSNDYFSLYNHQGKCTFRVNINEVSGGEVSLKLMGFEPIVSNKILFSKLSFNALSFKSFPSAGESIFLSLDIGNSQFNNLNVTYPEEAFLNDPDKSFKNKSRHHIALADKNQITYSFEFSSKVYQYQIGSGTVTEFPAKSRFTENIRQPYITGMSRKMETELDYTGPVFSKLHYDTKTGYFIRTHLNYSLTPNAGSNGSDISVKKYLMIFDKDFNTLSEYEIPERVSSNIFVQEGKIYFWKGGEPEKENTYELIVYTINSN